MAPLSSDVLCAFHAVRPHDRSEINLRRLAAFRQKLQDYAEWFVHVWSPGVERNLVARGVETVDHCDEGQCWDFLAEIDRNTLAKRYAREAAIGAARLEYERLASQLKCDG